MNKPLSSFILLLLGVILPGDCLAAISGNWKSYPTFDNSVVKVIDTPSKAYFMGYNQRVITSEPAFSQPDCSLFYLDKESDEIIAAFETYDMASKAVRMMEYNPFRNYLMVVYDDYDIDLLMDSGETFNIGALKNASIPGVKNVRFISFDPVRDLAWIATDFGYFAINDKDMEIAESRNYSQPLDCVTAVGDRLFIVSDGSLFSADLKGNRIELTDYVLHETLPSVKNVFPISDDLLLLHANTEPGNNMLHVYRVNSNGTLSLENERQGYWTYDFRQLPDKVSVFARSSFINYSLNGNKVKVDVVNRPADEIGVQTSSSWDMKEFFTALPRKGIRSATTDKDKTPIVTRDYAMPNAPTVYFSRAMAHHPRYGALVNNFGNGPAFESFSIKDPILLCGLGNGKWTRYSPAYYDAEQTYTGRNPLGLLIDSVDDKYVWMGSVFSGMTRLNLEDPSDILHYSFPGDPTAGLPGYVESCPIYDSWKQICHFSAPKLDSEGNLWTFHHNPDLDGKLEFRYLTPSDRKASTDAASARPFRKFLSDRRTMNSTFQSEFLPLKNSANRNMLAYITQNGVYIVDHKGTIDNTSDDNIAVITNFTDQDGGTIDLYKPYVLFEDVESGVIWIGANSGLYYCQPRSLMQGQSILNRVKISRNDGTSFADYLLSGVPVSSITSDGNGRKWIGTIGAGLVATSADGRTVYAEFSTENSGLTSDNIYQVEYMPSSNSIMISTDKGLCQFFIGGSADSPALDDSVRAFPNPVTPDYYGWVTIDQLPDDSLVKIADSAGNLVRELGRAESGSIQWDINDMRHTRVKSGVYYILISSASGGKEARVAKILVMN